MKRCTRGISLCLMVILVVGLQGWSSEAVPNLTGNLSFTPEKVSPYPYRATWLETVDVQLSWDLVRLLDLQDVQVNVAGLDAMTTVDPLSNVVSFVLPKHIWGGPQQFSVSGVQNQTRQTLAKGIINVLGQSVFDDRDDPTANVPTTSIFFISQLGQEDLRNKLRQDFVLEPKTNFHLGGHTKDSSPCNYTLYEAQSVSRANTSPSVGREILSVGREIEALEETHTVVDVKGILAADPRPGQSLNPVKEEYLIRTENAVPIDDVKMIVGGGNLSSEDTTIAILDSGISETLATDARYHVLDSSISFLPEDDQAYIDGFNNTDGVNVGHGTAVAALASSISPSSKILSIKVCDSTGKCPLASVVRGICYAVNYAKSNPKTQTILNLSLGSDTPSQIIYTILRDAMSSPRIPKDMDGPPLLLVTASSGNDWENNQLEGHKYGDLFHYPAAFEGTKGLSAMKRSRRTIASLKDLISVGAVGQSSDGRLLAARFSNQGDYISLAAPGIKVISKRPTGEDFIFTGTSFATPIVSGALALMSHSRFSATYRPPATARVIKAELLKHVRNLPGIDRAAVKDVIGEGLLDLRR